MRLGGVALSALLCGVTACGSDPCGMLVGVDLRSKEVGCPTVATTVTPDLSLCQAAIQNCTQADQASLSDYADCLDQVPNCVAGRESTFAATILACGSRLGGVTAPCMQR